MSQYYELRESEPAQIPDGVAPESVGLASHREPVALEDLTAEDAMCEAFEHGDLIETHQEAPY